MAPRQVRLKSIIVVVECVKSQVKMDVFGQIRLLRLPVNEYQ